ncbi:MAG: type II toxin-antitoxin system RelE/ParE family toxin [Proteobacteria bacterium]|nr:type II toxin-antitoxin system RelE/ParE family toxin [Pseudomonadota bacterium]
MIRRFGDSATEVLWNGESTTASRKIPADLWPLTQRKLDVIHAAHELGDFRAPPGNRLEKLKGDLKDRYSIRVNDRYRIVFRWSQGGADDVKMTDYHRG